jgi:protein-S-isoprenylcysteine O-methyltransferase Ste14
MTLQAMWQWSSRTPVVTFIICPIAVVVVDVLLQHGKPAVVPWGALLLAWGYLQYRLVGSYRHPRAGGSAGMGTPPDHLLDTGPYRYTRNPMYLGHLIFMLGLAITFRSWFALLILAVRAAWFQKRVLHDEARLDALFGTEYAAYRARVKRWLPGIF